MTLPENVIAVRKKVHESIDSLNEAHKMMPNRSIKKSIESLVLDLIMLDDDILCKFDL